ncbi:MULTISPECIES: DUF6798 domain-containing protein [unclassified Ruegeria]|uniref:DUF6798 domain-containing protein n=1 Tax=unclassified Ruegeria TaxID=2625375 RepID=UPI001488B6CD|nr:MULTISPECIES: DUF6798 domain-containing protein [unclassified Ruegeria]
MSAQPKSPQPGPFQILLLLAMLSLLPLVGALFGHGNQVEQLPIIARLLDPSAMAGDFYTDHATAFGPRIYYAKAMAALVSLMPLPIVVHSLMCLFAFVLGAVTYLGARNLVGASSTGALFAAALAITNGSFSLGLAGFLRFDSFQPANVAIALALGGMVLLFTGRVWLSVVAFVPAALMHPLIGTEIAMMAFLAAVIVGLLTPETQPRLRTVAPIVGAGVLFVVLMVVFWALPGGGHESAKLTDAEFFDILISFRAPHHYLGTEFFRRSWIEAGLFVALTTCIFLWFAARRALPGKQSLMLALVCLMVLVGCAASLWFTDVQHSRLWATAQVFRMLMVVKWAGFLLLGRLIGDLYTREQATALICALILLLASADAQPYAVTLVLLVCLAVWIVRKLLKTRAEIVIWLGLGFSVLIAAALAWRYGVPMQTLRGVAAFALLALVLLRPFRGSVMLAVILSIGLPLALAMVAKSSTSGPLAKTAFSWSDHRDAEADIARQARTISPEGAIWVVPPDQERFRLLANRGVLVSFTAIPFDDAGLMNWRNRLEALYGPFTKRGFGALREMRRAHRENTDWIPAATQLGASFAVLYADTPWDGTVLYENDQFKAVALDGS